MSIIESAAKHSTWPLIVNKPFLLDTFGRFTLASVLCLITMRIEFVTGMIAISPGERDWLRHRFEPSNHWKMWIGRYGGTRHGDSWSRSYAAQIEPKPTDKVGPEYCNVRVATLVIGQLCAHIFYSPVIDFKGYEGLFLPQIWPPGPFNLDTSFLPVMTDEQVLFLHEAFAREMTPIRRGASAVDPILPVG
jgi:hypothetical protein